MEKHIRVPVDKETAKSLSAGDYVYLTGTVYTARDAAHKRMEETLREGGALPFDIKGQVIYYMGPSPRVPGFALGSAGPTTSQRMDPYSPALMREGLLLMVGKGPRKKEVREAIVKYSGLYLQAFGGCGALYSERIKKAEVVAFEDLGPEALLKLEVEDFPTICVIDSLGRCPYSLS